MVFVGVVSLNFSLDAVSNTNFTQPGPAWMVDLDSISTGSYSLDLTALNNYGMSSLDDPVSGTSGLGYDDAAMNACTSLSNGTTQYFMTLRNPE